ncbi:tetratricopeptide repeat protein 12 [Pelodytes ibericus]
MSEEKSLDDFLRNVEEITQIVQNLNSTDEACRENAFVKADEKLAQLKEKEEIEGTRTKLNRTVINTSCNVNFPQPTEFSISLDFLFELEKDAKQRAERRKEKTMLANALKELGNEAFARGDYATAVQRYTEGLDKLKDMQVLYTNRAQAYIKLEKYQDALTDCEWALKCDNNFIKAYVQMGRAYLGLKDYNKARTCYLKVIQTDSSQEKLVKGYLNKVDSQERKDNQEQKAQEEFEAGRESAVTVIQLLQKLSKADQIPLYYSGGIKLLSEVIKDCTGQTLFRTNNGFSIIGDNSVINRSIITPNEDPIDVDLRLSVLSLWKTVCNGNEENQSLLISQPNMNKQILTLLSSEAPEVQTETLALLSVYSTTETGQSLLLKRMDANSLLQSLLEYVLIMDGRSYNAMNILHNLTLEERFKILCRTNFAAASLPCITGLLRKIKQVNKEMFPRWIGVIGNLIEDRDIRRQMAGSLEAWDSCLSVVDECGVNAVGEEQRDILVAILGLMLNLSVEVSAAIQERGTDISSRCMSLLCSTEGVVLTRSVGILSRLLPHSTASVDQTVQGGIVKKLVKLLKANGPRTSRYAAKALAVCTDKTSQAQKDVVKHDKKFSTLLHHLRSDDEIIIGNVALCLGHCFQVPGAASSLLQSDILKLLLTHAKEDSQRTTVQQNSAIALGKLCTAESRYMTQLRELHGIEILNSCMKYIE